MSFVEYFDLDIHFVFFLLLALIIFVIIKSVKYAMNYLYNKLIGLSNEKPTKMD
jgi:large-conductance mechanosensitive channel